MDVVSDFITNHSPHILGITETWLDPEISSASVAVHNYNFIRNDRGIVSSGNRSFIQGGGVGCYVHRSLRFKILCSSDNDDINQTEFLIAEILTSTTPVASRLLFAVVYRRPDGFVLHEFFSKLENFLALTSLSPLRAHSFRAGTALFYRPGYG